MAVIEDTIEEFIHTPEGELKSKDPYQYYLIEGNLVRMINSEKAATVSCDVRQGAVGVISEGALRNTKRDGGQTKPRRVYVEWKNKDLLLGRGEYDPNGSVIFHCYEDCVEPA